MTRTESLRIRKGWSQNQMGEYLGLSQSQVSRLETRVSEESGAIQRLLDLLEAECLADPPVSAGSSNPGAQSTGG